MRLLDKLTAQPFQEYTVATEAGDLITLTLRYMPSQQCWAFGIVWGLFSLQGAQLTIAPNILYNYANIVPFGFMVTSTDTIEPSYLDDFSTGRIKVYVLEQSDIDLLEATLAV
jgi:hypothetical protein